MVARRTLLPVCLLMLFVSFVGAKTDAPAAAALTSIEKKYGKTSWFASHEQDFAAARAQAKGGSAEARAEKLYTEAVQFFRDKTLWELKAHLDELKKPEYAQTAPLTDATRKPSLADMAKAVTQLGKFLTVRLDGEGDCKTIQAAINAAPPNSLIEIQDDGPYNEKLVIPKDKEGLTLRGKKGCWPVITSLGPRKNIDILVKIQARTTLERLILAHTAPGGLTLRCVSVENGTLRLQHVTVYMQGTEAFFVDRNHARCLVEGCFVLANGRMAGRTVITNSVWLGPRLWFDLAPEIRRCTIPAHVALTHPAILSDSIVAQVRAGPGHQIEHCNVYGKPPFGGKAKPGKGCFSKNPQFRDPKNFDYRLKPTSPCRKKASDGGDVGCRYTPEMIEMMKKAQELRKKGIINF